MMTIRNLLFCLCCSSSFASAQAVNPLPIPEVYISHAGHRRPVTVSSGGLAAGSLAEITVVLPNGGRLAGIGKILYKAPGAVEFMELAAIAPLRSSQATIRIPPGSAIGEAEILVRLGAGGEQEGRRALSSKSKSLTLDGSSGTMPLAVP